MELANTCNLVGRLHDRAPIIDDSLVDMKVIGVWNPDAKSAIDRITESRRGHGRIVCTKALYNHLVINERINIVEVAVGVGWNLVESMSMSC